MLLPTWALWLFKNVLWNARNSICTNAEEKASSCLKTLRE